MRRAEREAAEELARLLDGASPADADPTLRALATLATEVRTRTVVPEPDPEFAARLRATLLREPVPASPFARFWDVLDRRTARLRNSVRAATAGGVAAALLGTTGVALAAQHAVPGDLLYGLKRGTESLRLQVARGDVADGRLHLAHAEERLEELTAMHADGPGELGPTLDTLESMDDSAVDGAEALLRAFVETADAGLTALVSDFTARQAAGLDELEDRVPAAAVPAVAASRELLRRIDVRVAEVAAPCGDCEPEPVGTSPTAARTDPEIVAPGEGPAVSVTGPCRCGPGAVAPIPREPDVVDTDVVEQPPDTTVEQVPEPADDPAEPAPPPAEPDEPFIDLPAPLDPVEAVIDEAIAQVREGAGGAVDAVVEGDDPLPDPVEEPVDDGAEDVGELVDDLLGG